MKILTVFGTRPEEIKMALVVKALAADLEFNLIECVTARQLLDQLCYVVTLADNYS